METLLIIMMLLIPLALVQYLIEIANIERRHRIRMKIIDKRFHQAVMGSSPKKATPRKLPIRL